jgi:hypothetical protein
MSALPDGSTFVKHAQRVERARGLVVESYRQHGADGSLSELLRLCRWSGEFETFLRTANTPRRTWVATNLMPTARAAAFFMFWLVVLATVVQDWDGVFLAWFSGAEALVLIALYVATRSYVRRSFLDLRLNCTITFRQQFLRAVSTPTGPGSVAFGQEIALLTPGFDELLEELESAATARTLIRDDAILDEGLRVATAARAGSSARFDAVVGEVTDVVAAVIAARWALDAGESVNVDPLPGGFTARRGALLATSRSVRMHAALERLAHTSC